MENDLGSISQKVVSLRLIVSVIVSVISKLLIGCNSHLRLILDLQHFVKSTTEPYPLIPFNILNKWIHFELVQRF